MEKKNSNNNSGRFNLSILTKRKFIIYLLIHFLIALIVLIITPFFGSTLISHKNLFNNAIIQNIFFSYRLPRIISAFLLGGILSLSGILLQSTLKNPLVEPYTLGISSMAALGAFIGSFFLSFLPFSSFILSISTSLIVSLLIFILAHKKGVFSTYNLLLAGITISIFGASVITLMRYLLNPFSVNLMDRWLIGSLSISNWKTFFSLFFFSIPLLLVSIYYFRDFNQLYFTKEISISRGVDVEKIQKIIFVIVSITISGAVALFGPIGFVGLIVPHINRKIIGYDFRILIPVSFLSGGIFLTISDTISRSLIPPTEFPVGIITALLGAPFFIYILINSKKF